MAKNWEFNETELSTISKEFKRLKNNTYVDHAGTTLYADSQIEAAANNLRESIYCNPHTCRNSGDMIDNIRYRILRHFNTTIYDYSVIFTANATAAIKLVAETFNFENDGGFYYCQENHTSVLGMRELVDTDNIFVLTMDEIIHQSAAKHQQCTTLSTGNSLIAFSAQCNYSGFKVPLNIIDSIHQYGLCTQGKRVEKERCKKSDNSWQQRTQKFYVLLDAASFVATNYLDLNRFQPDFVCLSFYKMFGFPTGLGALLVHRKSEEVLKKRYYGGGTVNISMTRINFHEKRLHFSSRFEDGTLPFLNIASLIEGFRVLERLIPATPTRNTMQRISLHVFQLAKYFYERATSTSLRYENGEPLLKFYHYRDAFANGPERQGGIVNFNVLHEDGSYVGFGEVACLAAIYDIQLRTGCFCNPGACQKFLQLSDSDIRKQYASGHICSDYNDLVDGVPTGSVRISFGYMSRKEDADRVLKMLDECFLTGNRTERRKRLIAEPNSLPNALRHIPERWKPQLKAIFIYPIKSCAAFRIDNIDAVSNWPLDNTGLRYDRNWMIVNDNGVPLTQKHHPRLCLIRPSIRLDRQQLEINFDDLKSISISLECDSSVTDDALNGNDSLISRNSSSSSSSVSFCQSKVCNDLVSGIDCGDDVAEWLSDCLQLSGLRLIQQCEARRYGEDGSIKDISLVNQAQFLLINRNSVQWLAKQVTSEQEPLDVTVDRFRANFILETEHPLEENDFESLIIDGIPFKVDGYCTRCQMICIDQRTGQRTAEPLRTIAKVFNGKIRFGIYLSIARRLPIDTKLSFDPNIVIDIKKRRNQSRSNE